MIFVHYSTFYKEQKRWTDNKPFGVYQDTEQALKVLNNRHKNAASTDSIIYEYYACKIESSGRILRNAGAPIATYGEK